MIVLLGCSINLLANNTNIDSFHPSTGEVVQFKDSVLISYDDLRLVNSKLIELKCFSILTNSILTKEYRFIIII